MELLDPQRFPSTLEFFKISYTKAMNMICTRDLWNFLDYFTPFPYLSFFYRDVWMSLGFSRIFYTPPIKMCR